MVAGQRDCRGRAPGCEAAISDIETVSKGVPGSPADAWRPSSHAARRSSTPRTGDARQCAQAAPAPHGDLAGVTHGRAARASPTSPARRHFAAARGAATIVADAGQPRTGGRPARPRGRAPRRSPLHHAILIADPGRTTSTTPRAPPRATARRTRKNAWLGDRGRRRRSITPRASSPADAATWPAAESRTRRQALGVMAQHATYAGAAAGVAHPRADQARRARRWGVRPSATPSTARSARSPTYLTSSRLQHGHAPLSTTEPRSNPESALTDLEEVALRARP